jgi:3-deoxy-D-manno-octulosonic-acid transferase
MRQFFEKGNIVFQFYRFLTVFIGPFYLKRHLKKRVKVGKEIKDRLQERQGFSSLERPEGHLIWVHAASVGESLSALRLIDKILQEKPTTKILVTTGTVTSAQLMKERLPSNAFHQFLPFDVPQWVDKFLTHWRPDLALWVESELWPNWIQKVNKRKIPLVLINGRISDRSYKKWGIIHSFIRSLLEKFNLCLVQSTEHAHKFSNLGAKDVKVVGNLKFSSSLLPYAPDQLDHFLQKIKNRPLWLAASTHEGEEEIVARVHQNLKENFPDLLTIIVPRHPERGAEVANALSKAFNIKRRSLDPFPDQETEIFIGDTLGELGLFYRLCDIVFVGGSLVPIGGHNMIEPAQLGCAVLHGPYMNNQKEQETLFKAHEASVLVQDVETLTDAIKGLLNSADLRAVKIKGSMEVAKSQAEVLDKTLKELQPFLHNL